MPIIIFALLLGVIPGVIAQGKGRNFVSWWLYGAAIFIVALPHSLMLKPDAKGLEAKQMSEGMKKCLRCAEMIKAEATVCRYCSSPA